MKTNFSMAPTNRSSYILPILEEEPEPVFVVGMNGSGTSMLIDCLGNHPLLFAAVRETRTIPRFITTVDRYGDLAEDKNFAKLWRSFADTPAFAIINEGKPPELPQNWREFPRSLAAVLDAVFRHFAAQQGKIRWAEKTPQHVQHLDALHRLFPRAKFVHIIRDGRDCAASFHRRWRRSPELTVYRWKHVVKTGRNSGRSLGNSYMEVRYEELTSNPEQWMRKICEFIDLPFDQRVLLSRRPQSEKPITSGGIESSNSRWQKYFSEDELRRLERISGKYLKELGYEPEYCEDNSDPNTLLLSYWRIRDYGWNFFETLQEKQQNKKKRTWRHTFRAMRTAWGQFLSNRY